MGDVPLFPPQALGDVRVLLRLNPDQLARLAELFATSEGGVPWRARFIEKVAEELRVSLEAAKAVVAVTHFVLIKHRTRVGSDAIDEVLSDMREFLAEASDPPECDDDLAAFDRHRIVLRDLLTPKAPLLRAEKVQRLTSGPEAQIQDSRTICQLRPLFESTADEEMIDGFVSVTLLELDVIDSDGDVQTFVFGIPPSAIDTLEATLFRAKQKLKAIQQKYENELHDDYRPHQ